MVCQIYTTDTDIYGLLNVILRFSNNFLKTFMLLMNTENAKFICIFDSLNA